MARELGGETLFAYPMSHEGIHQMHGLSQMMDKETAVTVSTTAQLHRSVNL